ncbi:MAG: thioesterase domain-containing protein [Chloroflexota bacterium]|nr:thioesterase domain-containing protein [Chloroflexota bacterium]
MDERERQARALEETLHHEIPLSLAMGLAVAGYDGERLTLRAPLAPNINHKSTAFAGSLNALTTLAGWGLIWLITHEHDLPSVIVIQESATHYLRPVGQDFVATCHIPPARQVERFVTALRERGRARLPLTAEIVGGDGQVAVSFTGRYVAFLAHTDEPPTRL